MNINAIRKRRIMNPIIIKIIFLLIAILFLSMLALYSKEAPAPVALIPIEDKTVHAVRTKQPIQLDGILNEQVWQGKGYSDFVQSEPKDGLTPTEKTTVWIAYDDTSLYIAARMYDSEPGKIIARLGRRDDSVNSDWFDFCIDPYFDRRTGFQFSVNPSGAIKDAVLFNDSWNDYTWDGAWQSATKIDAQGWTVEIKIPYSQLRFKKQDSYTWGINFIRTIKRKNEVDGYVWIPKTESGFVSRFAKMDSITAINPGRLAEVTPYVVGQSLLSPSEAGNPFKTGKNNLGNAGAEFKLGLKSNLILDMTVNPDFGQVEVDPAVINLSAYETFYDEKRPFFVEGAKIFEFGFGGSNNFWGFNWVNPSFFYSRRIGRAPQGSVSNDDAYADYPLSTTILSASKLTGQISDGFKIGILDAVTQREQAGLFLDGNRWKEEIEPLSNYFVARSQKEFDQGREGLGFITTNIFRDLHTEALRDQFNRTSSSFGVDGWTSLDQKKVWMLTGWFGATRITGSENRMYDVQQSSLHYFQRPDTSHVALNLFATAMNGWAGRMTLNKQEGNWYVNAAVGASSPGFDSSDMGFQWIFDRINGHAVVGYRSFQPGKYFMSWSIYSATNRSYDFGGNKTYEGYFIFTNGKFKNYWSGEIDLYFNRDAFSVTMTRGGPLMINPSAASVFASIYTDDRKPLIFELGTQQTSGSRETREHYYYTNVTWKPKSNLSVTVGPGFSHYLWSAQWVDNITDSFMHDTYNTRYVFGFLEQRIFQIGIRTNWIFSPKLSLQLYFQPFIAVGKYNGFKELAAPSTYNFNYYGNGNSTISLENGVYTVDPDGSGPVPSFTFDNPDFNYKSLRGTVVLRWEYRLGSVIYFVWTSNRESDANPGDFNFHRDFTDLFHAKGDNTFLVKFTYRFNI